MATKEEVLQLVSSFAQQKLLSKAELDAAYNAGSGVTAPSSVTKRIGIAEILYYIGGAIVFLGISIFLAQNWSTLGLGTKVLTTLGAGFAAYVAGLLFQRDERTETVGSAFYLISALVIPTGLYVVFDNAGFDAGSFGTQSLISGILFAMYFASYLVLRKSVFIVFSILFGTWLFFSLTSSMVGGNPYFDWKFYAYRVLGVGLTYILLGYSFSKTKLASIQGFLYSFGILGFLGAALMLGGWKPHQNMFWELTYPGLVFGALLISVHLKSKAFLTFGTLFLMAYILKITSEYFSSGLGWPLALVVAGLALIGVGFMSLTLKKKYLTA